MSLRLAVHWTATALTAAIVSTAATIPFTAPAAGYIGSLAATGVCMAGLAGAPAITRQDNA